MLVVRRTRWKLERREAGDAAGLDAGYAGGYRSVGDVSEAEDDYDHDEDSDDEDDDDADDDEDMSIDSDEPLAARFAVSTDGKPLQPTLFRRNTSTRSTSPSAKSSIFPSALTTALYSRLQDRRPNAVPRCFHTLNEL